MPTEPVPKPTLKPAAMVPVAAVTTFSPGTLVVQVAAMSHQEDADVVAVDLKRRGYPVAIRRESQDKLFHVQIGPLSNKKEADAMRQRLQTDGYNNAIVK
jgi:cell division septation protein DedD